MKQLTTIIFLLFSVFGFGQELNKNYKEYSYSELFKMIEEEKDTIFKLKDAIIKYNAKTDSLLTTVKYEFLDMKQISKNPTKRSIDKEINLENVLFNIKFSTKKDSINDEVIQYTSGSLLNFHFKRKVAFTNVTGLNIYHSIFDEPLRFSDSRSCSIDKEFLRKKAIFFNSELGHNTFYKGFLINQRCDEENKNLSLQIFKNTIYTNFNIIESKKNTYARIFNTNTSYTLIISNIYKGSGSDIINISKTKSVSIAGNIFETPRAKLSITGAHDELVLKENDLNKGIQLNLSNLKPTDLIEWKQFNNTIYSLNAFNNYTALLPDKEYNKINTDSFTTHYREKLRFQNSEVYAGEAALRGILYRHYRDNFDMVSANKVYMNLKDYETKHLKYQFESNPSFDTYFQWKVNQFLKVFSDYGTKPSKAITFSVYVIFVFALIYLFFPNSWDKHGKNRILDRYRFFLKYMNKDAGIHEVYLDDQKEELLEYSEYRKLIESSDKKVPSFFTSTAMPIYKWSISGIQFTESILKRIDIIKGSWSDLPKSKRLWKSILLISAFLVAISYDVFIKALNALMLSINTFTTLGFGEIPIKGLPRYLAIIQGFIGWFMLTIFSVSLISQLLN